MPRTTLITWAVAAVAISTIYFRQIREERYVLCSAPGQRSIYTVDAGNSVAECVSIRGSKLDAVGSFDEIHGTTRSLLWSDDITFISEDAIIVPGLSDSHAHMLEYGKNAQLALEGTKTIEGEDKDCSQQSAILPPL
ncbi:hypothetical protein AAF712_013175 [Marasmius tenuissimus]|uniref:Amidohydrolase 3 domain-containing protein n=1 Tax=Marasmius tenuissimus TaxID=585030 RepID=A0ABR2ZFN5_9AGAR